METFKCDRCGKDSEKGSDEVALAELEQYFPGVKVEECGQVCDECWELIHPAKNPANAAKAAEAIATTIAARGRLLDDSRGNVRVDLPEEPSFSFGALRAMARIRAEAISKLVTEAMERGGDQVIFLEGDLDVRGGLKPRYTPEEFEAITINKPLKTIDGATRNGPCPCGSGKKFKRCCRRADRA